MNLATNEYGTEARTEWIVPDVNAPFDYIISYHKVYNVQNVIVHPGGYEEWVVGDPLWSDICVVSYSDFLLF